MPSLGVRVGFPAGPAQPLQFAFPQDFGFCVEAVELLGLAEDGGERVIPGKRC